MALYLAGLAQEVRMHALASITQMYVIECIHKHTPASNACARLRDLLVHVQIDDETLE